MNQYDAGLNARNGFPVFSTQIEANWLSKSEDKYTAFRLTDEDKDEINRLSKDPQIGERLSDFTPADNLCFVPLGSQRLLRRKQDCTNLHVPNVCEWQNPAPSSKQTDAIQAVK